MIQALENFDRYLDGRRMDEVAMDRLRTFADMDRIATEGEGEDENL